MAIEIGDTCKKGHEVSGDNIQYYNNSGKRRVRCSKCNQPPFSRKKPGDTCRYGHVIIGDNLMEKKNPGGISYACRECQNGGTRRYQAKKDADAEHLRDKRDRNQSKSALHSARRAADKSDEMIGTGKEDNALMYLKLNKRAERMSDALQAAMLRNKAKCADNPGPWIDYEEEDAPTKENAYKMCVGCPVLVDCDRFAVASRPEVGVWGGQTWREGKLLHK